MASFVKYVICKMGISFISFSFVGGGGQGVLCHLYILVVWKYIVRRNQLGLVPCLGLNLRTSVTLKKEDNADGVIF